MLYREVGEFKTSYAQDSQTFPIKFDRYRYYFSFSWIIIYSICYKRLLGKRCILTFSYLCNSFIRSKYFDWILWSSKSRTGGFMAVGAYASYKLMTAFPDLNIFFVIVLLSGL